ncbi:MAG: hypothetical protein ACFBSC_01510 [Microcoleaceae cyanobacterium]
MIDPLFWLGLSILLVALSLAAVLMALLPAVQAIARAARSVEKLADTLQREFPPTLEAIRMTGLEISELTDDVTQGVQSAGQVVKQVDESLLGARRQAQRVQNTTGNIFTGIRVAWRTFTRKSPALPERRSSSRLTHASEVLPPNPVKDQRLSRSESQSLESDFDEGFDSNFEQGFDRNLDRAVDVSSDRTLDRKPDNDFPERSQREPYEKPIGRNPYL